MGFGIGPYHGDFASWNVRSGADGKLWVMDWRRLEFGHWLEAAYRFYYTVSISALSPFARPNFYKSILRRIEYYIQITDPIFRNYFRTRAVFHIMYDMCRRNARSPKRYLIQKFLMQELSGCIEGR